jgi:hypothetical protein
MLSKNSLLTGGALLLLSFSTFAQSLQGRIDGFELASCHSLHCFRLSSPVAYISRVDGSFAFDEAKLSVRDRTLASKDVYYDRNLNKVFVRNVEGTDYIYDVKSGELTRYGQ